MVGHEVGHVRVVNLLHHPKYLYILRLATFADTTSLRSELSMQLFESMRISCKADDATGVVIKSMYCNIGYEERERERERDDS